MPCTPATFAQDDDRRHLGAWALKSQSAQRIQAALRLAQTERAVVARPEDFDRHPWLFNVMNGTLDLRTGTLRPHDPTDMITRLAPVHYVPEATAPRFERFMNQIMDEDTDRVTFSRRLFGYCLTGSTREQIIVVLHGLGANGKSTLLEVLRAVYGDYSMHADPSAFLTRRGDGPRNDIARLKGARFVTASETTEGRRLDSALVKQLSGGDTVTARHLYREYFEFKPEFTVVLSTNHRPRVAGDDDAIWRRLRLVPFNVTFPPEQQDRDLVAKLTAEGAGILKWLVDGCLEWQREGLPVPEAVQKATAEYRAESDALGLFLEERAELGTAASVRASDLYAAYRIWAESTGEHVHSQRRFGQLLTDRGFERFRGGSDGSYRYRGLNLLNLSEPSTGKVPYEGDTRGLYGNIVQNRSDRSVVGRNAA